MMRLIEVVGMLRPFRFVSPVRQDTGKGAALHILRRDISEKSVLRFPIRDAAEQTPGKTAFAWEYHLFRLVPALIHDRDSKRAALWLSVLLTYTSLLFSSDMGNGVYGLVSIFKVHIYTIIISYPRRKHKFYDFLETFERRISLISRTAAGFSLPAYRTVTLHPST